MTLASSYHGSVAEKKATLAQLRAHRAADQIVKGSYWSDGKGCAVGCLTHSPDGGHDQFPDRWGIPVQVAYLVDQLFELLPVEVAVEWPVRFMSAVPVGADLSGVWDRWCVWMLSGLVVDGVDGSVVVMRDLFVRAVAGDEPSVEEWSRAAWAAEAAWAARAAEAARAAWAARAARAAWAEGAAEAAWAAGAAWAAEACDELVRLVKSAPRSRP